MDAYNIVVTGGKVLVVIYLVAIPWTLGEWMFVPIFTGFGSLSYTFCVLVNKPTDNGDAATMEILNNHWATQLLVGIAYVIYYIAAACCTIWLQLKWFDRQDRKEAEARWRRRRPLRTDDYFVINDAHPSSVPITSPRRLLADKPHDGT